MVYYHGACKPFGLERTYPCIINYEGVQANEWNKWSKDETPKHTVEIAFIRNLAGPMDVNLGPMRNGQGNAFAISDALPMSMGTRCHQLAMYITYYAPFNMVADAPFEYINDKHCINLIASVPSNWDNSKAIDGKISEYLIMARNKGFNWYLSGLNNEMERSGEVKLDFLEEGNYTASAFEEVFWSDPAQAANAVAPVYDALNGFANGENMRLSNSSGGQIADIRAFGGGGYLQKMWKHTWDASDGSLNQMWNTFYKGVTASNFIMSQLEGLADRPSNYNKIVAQLKVMRAFFLYHAMDNFGNIPLDTLYGADPNSIKTNPRLEVFNFLEKELIATAPLLDNKSDSNYGRANKQVAYTLLAQLYINAQVYTGTPRWADAISACDKVIGSGLYSLSTNYFNNFSFDNNNHKNENILVAPKDRVLNNFPGMMETINDNGGKAVGITGTPWNGFCATADIYNKYQASDKRIRQWLVGRQREANGTRTIDDDYSPGGNITAGNGILSYNRQWFQ